MPRLLPHVPSAENIPKCGCISRVNTAKAAAAGAEVVARGAAEDLTAALENSDPSDDP